LRVTDRNYMAHNNLAIALAKAGRPDEAVVEFRAAKSLHKYPPSQILALALYELRVGHPGEAAEECDSVLRDSGGSLDPKLQAAAWSELGQAYLQLHEYDRAAASYQTALRLTPENEMARVGSGLLALRKGQADEAVAELAQAVKIDPSAVNFLLFSQALRRAGRAAEADSAAAQARKISSDLSLDQNEAQITAGQFLSIAGLAPI
jgi:tetratricopeptide (TPR) repeat protein